ncbi:GntR family transcriptional regulator [Nocardia ignorata]|uniref:GntR family transcriptional regulator n=1 Tax=Nocardia ignorata TaxID=145285 RepID=A0A4R6PM59_NOCIG|nr:GntR family transcriptional regulator [Nocardia ignorata]TDP38743.1 GntR family transcriptional regulator [Nocardia ignorata]
MPEPKYVAIANKYAADIRKGVIPPNVWLPSHAEIARENGVSEIVARQAVGQLRRWGLVTTVERRGTQVLAQRDDTRLSPERQTESPETTYETEATAGVEVVIDRQSAEVVADEALADTFGIDVGAALVHETVRASEDGRPISISDSYHLPGQSPPEADILEEELSERVPPESHSEWLGVPAGEPILMVKQRYLTSADRLLMLSDVSYIPGRYRTFSFRMVLPRE